MRPFFVIILALLILGLPLSRTFATGNVLVPSTNNSSGRKIFGIVTPQCCAKAGDLDHQVTPCGGCPVTRANIYTGAHCIKPKTSTQQTQPPIPEFEKSIDDLKAKILASPNVTTEMKNYVQNASQTQVVKLPNYPSITSKATMSMPKSIDVDIDPNWNLESAKRVSDQLGIPVNQVPVACHISAGGTFITDQGIVKFDTAGSNHAVAQYGGQIMANASFMPVALCHAPNSLPPNRGIVMQVGDNYMVLLRGGGCTAPTGASASRILISSATNSPWQCVFQ